MAADDGLDDDVLDPGPNALNVSLGQAVLLLQEGPQQLQPPLKTWDKLALVVPIDTVEVVIVVHT